MFRKILSKLAIYLAKKCGLEVGKQESQEDKLNDMEASYVMTPRVDIVGIDKGEGFDALLQVMIKCGHSRIVVYSNDMDHVDGLVYTKDILPFVKKDDSFAWQKYIRKPVFVLQDQNISCVLKVLQEKKERAAIVTDEYGGTVGLISMRNILEEVVGEMESSFYRQLNASTYILDGRMPFLDFCRLVDAEDDFFEKHESEYETVAGLVLESLGRFPELGESVFIAPYSFTVEAKDNLRIKKIRMCIEGEKDEK